MLRPYKKELSVPVRFQTKCNLTGNICQVSLSLKPAETGIISVLENY